MLLSFKWLCEWVELPPAILPKDLAEHLTMAGLEVESIQNLPEDTLLEINVTPNRSDALSHMGVARELAALLQIRTMFPSLSVKELGSPTHDVAHVNILAREACYRYACRVLDGVTVGPSPDWLKSRVEACGIRSVNNVVDVTNWVLLERGQPMHAFDFGLLHKDRTRTLLSIRQAVAGEKLTTLDGKDRTLTADDIVIADPEKPLALAGVMGGKETEVTESTTSVLLESAYFEPGMVRSMARRHGLSTEGSYRFERGTDPNGVVAALDRAAELIVKVAGGKIRRDVIDMYPRPISPIEISVRRHKMAEISGLPEAELDEAKIRARFLLLGVETVGRRGDAIIFRVPTCRPDLTREIDLIEEAMRLIGFDKVPPRILFKKRSSHEMHDASLEQVTDRARDAFASAGFFEALNFSFGSKSRFELFEERGAGDFITVQNPMGEEQGLMRKSLLPGLLDNVLYNIHRGSKSIRLFEIGTVFLGRNPDGTAPNTAILSKLANQDAWAHEKRSLAGVMVGPYGLSSFDTKPKKSDFYDLKGAIEEFLSTLFISAELSKAQVRWEVPRKVPVFLHPGSSAEIWVKDARVGVVGALHPDVQAAYQLKDEAFVFELDLPSLSQVALEYLPMSPLPKFPSIERDLALLVDDSVTSAEITQEILKVKKVKSLLSELKIFDVYKGDKIPADKKSVALSLTLRDLETTLTDEKASELMSLLTETLQLRLGALVR